MFRWLWAHRYDQVPMEYVLPAFVIGGIVSGYVGYHMDNIIYNIKSLLP